MTSWFSRVRSKATSVAALAALCGALPGVASAQGGADYLTPAFQSGTQQVGYWLGEEEEEEEEEKDEPTLEERLAELEAKYSDLDDAHNDLKKSLKGYAKTGHKGATMKVNGRIHIDNWGFPDDSPGVNGLESGDPDESPQDEFEFRRLRFGVKGDLPYNMLYKIEMEFGDGNNPEFRDAYFGWKEIPFFQTVLIGNQKRPYGLDHLNSSRYNVFLERPTVIEGFNQDARRFGIQSYGVSQDEAWNWRYGVFNQRLIQDEGEFLSDHYQAQIAGRLANTVWWDEASDGRGYAHWAVSGTWANTDQGADGDNFTGTGQNEANFNSRPEARTDSDFLDTGLISGADDYTLFGAEGVVNVGPFQVVGEYQHISLNRVADTHLDFWGGYVYLSYFLTGEHIPWDRRTGTLGRVIPHENFFFVKGCDGCTKRGIGAWQIAARYSYADFSDDDIQGGVGEILSFGVNWHWTPYARMQFNYLYGEFSQTDTALAEDEAPAGTPNFGNFQALGTRIMVDF